MKMVISGDDIRDGDIVLSGVCSRSRIEGGKFHATDDEPERVFIVERRPLPPGMTRAKATLAMAVSARKFDRVFAMVGHVGGARNQQVEDAAREWRATIYTYFLGLPAEEEDQQ